jgi:hypothetical protein
MNKMKLVEVTHFRRRLQQPSPTPHKCKELVSCLFCDTSTYPYDAKRGGVRVGTQKRCKGVICLDKLVTHTNKAHPECSPAEGRSLLDMDFTIGTSGDVVDTLDGSVGHHNESVYIPMSTADDLQNLARSKMLPLK